MIRWMLAILLCALFPSLWAKQSLAGVQVVDAYIGESPCTLESGVVPALGETSATDYSENREFTFSSTTSSAPVSVNCPKGFQVADPTYSTPDGGKCQSFKNSDSTSASLSCYKNNLSDCGGADCRATFNVTCKPRVSTKPKLKETDDCRLPGTYGQISSLSTALSLLPKIQPMLKMVEELRGGTAVPKTIPQVQEQPTPSSADSSPDSELRSPELSSKPQTETFRGRPGATTAQ